MKCKKSVLLNRYIDNELSENEREKLSVHISRCSECTKALQQLLKIDCFALNGTVPRSNFTYRMLQDELKRRSSAVYFPIPRWGIIAACIVVIAVGTTAGIYHAQNTIFSQETNSVQLVSTNNQNVGYIYTLAKEQ